MSQTEQDYDPIYVLVKNLANFTDETKAAVDALTEVAQRRDELLEALRTTRVWLRKLQPTMNIMCSECLDDIIKDQIDAAISRATGGAA